MKENTNAVRVAALALLQDNWSVIRLKPRTKKPPYEYAASAITKDNVSTLAANENIGVQFNKDDPRRDLDLDYQSAVDLAKEVTLTDATAGFGRPSVGIAHLLYEAPDCDAKKFELPESDDYPKPLPLHDGKPSGMVLEIRGAIENTHTMFPPSVHPDTGEILEWSSTQRAPLKAKPGELRAAAGRHAVAAAALYFYPTNASARYEARMALSGALVKSGMPETLVKTYVQAVARLGGDPKWKEDFVKVTERRFKAGKKASGLPKLIKVLQLPKVCERVFREWLQLGGEFQEDENTIVMRDGALVEIINKAEAALLSARLPIYQRSGELVMPDRGRMAGDSIRRDADTVSLFTIQPEYLVELMDSSAKWARSVKQGKETILKRADPLPKYARALLARPPGKWKFPRLLGVRTTPTLDRNGGIIEEPGYHAATGLLLDFKKGAYPEVPQQPTEADAETALQKLMHPLRGFPFEGETDTIRISPSRSVALSAMLSALVRTSLRTVPLHGFDAPVAGTGKSILAEAAAVLLSGTKPTAMAQGKSPEEDEKRLATVLHAGDPVIMIDNCQRQVTGDFLCMMLTQEVVQARILGLSERRVLPCTALVVATGNNLTFAGDVTRRSIRCVVDAKLERPDQRKFDFDFQEEIRADRAELVIAGLTILRAYVRAGRPVKLKPMGSFNDYAWVRGALVWLGQKDPADSREAILEADPHKIELAEILDAWERAYGAEAKLLAEVDDDLVRTLLSEASNRGQWSARSAGWWLKRNAKRIVHGRCFLQDARDDRSYWQIHYVKPSVKDQDAAQEGIQ